MAVSCSLIADKHPQKVAPFKALVESVREIIYRAVGFVISLTPYAVLALTASFTSTVSADTSQLWPLFTLLVVAFVVCFAHTYVVNGVFLRVSANVSPVAFFRKILPAQLTAFSTQSSAGTLPAHHEPAAHARRRAVRDRGLHRAARHHDRDARLRRHLADPAGGLRDQRAGHPVRARRLRGARHPRARRLDRHRRRPRHGDRHRDDRARGRRPAARGRHPHAADQRAGGHGPHDEQRDLRRRRRHDRRPQGRPARRRDLPAHPTPT